MKTMKQSYPRRKRLLATPFAPLEESEFRQLVTSGLAIPSQQGTGLFVAKWHNGHGIGAEPFLVALRAQGSTLEIRKYRQDVNIRVVRGVRTETGARTPASRVRKASG